jgi:UDP-glucose:(glucosyl)LPS alpha-1,2-glucosyltransferase
MSVVYRGQVINSALTLSANGGTEQMRTRLVQHVDGSLLEKVAIHFSRPGRTYEGIPNILYFHDLPEDPVYNDLEKRINDFDCFVFVSYWQRDQFISKFNLPYSKCTVIYNAIEEKYQNRHKPTDRINIIYHTTPHRGLELVYPIVDKLSEIHDNIHLNVYSSFEVYGWKERDEPYRNLFKQIENHPHMTYHGARPNSEVLEALRNTHIFLYPSIWKETSCIALIEAMVTGCFCIYPSYGALCETGAASSNVGMYDYSEYLAENATRAINTANWIISKHREEPGFIEKVLFLGGKNYEKHSIEVFVHRWEETIKKLLTNHKI